MLEQTNRYLADIAAGTWVWCAWSDRMARTADGFCQYCGSTEHDAYATRN